MPSLTELNTLAANAAHGKEVFKNNCALCHQVQGDGFNYGPALSEIGSKLPKEGLLDAILYPSKGISFGYEGWEIKQKDGSTVTGIISSKTESDITIKFPGGGSQVVKTANISERNALKESMMTEGIHENINNQDMADLLAYLTSLRKK